MSEYLDMQHDQPSTLPQEFAPEIEDASNGARTVAGGFLMAAAVGGLVFEQTPANEALRFNVGLDTLVSTQSEVAVGLAIGGLTTAIEAGAAGLIVAGLHVEPDAVKKIESGFNKFLQKIGLKRRNDLGDEAHVGTEETDASASDANEETKKRGKFGEFLADVAISMGLGAGIVTYRKHREDPNPTLQKDIKNTAKATGIVATLSGTIAWAIAGGSKYTNGTILEVPTNMLVEYGARSEVWVGALAAGLAGVKLNQKVIRPSHDWYQMNMLMPVVSRINDWKFDTGNDIGKPLYAEANTQEVR